LTRLVLDASIAMSWRFPDEENPYSRTVLRELREGEAVVPSIWPLEIANALVVSGRRGRLKIGEGSEFLTLVQGLEIEIDTRTSAQAFGERLSLARRYALPAHDAAYLELALRESLPLATPDSALKKAARKTGVPLLGE
jgi:predicted nucleic acid-binding protein